MPTYEFRCSDCGSLFEIVQRIDDDPLTVCERCGGRLRKVFHPAGIVFKGSGFYATDSRSKQSKDRGEKVDNKPESKGAKPADKGDGKKAAGSGSSS
jgi:putative FmdB family regulatory protein